MKLYKTLCAFLAVVLLLGCFPFMGVSVFATDRVTIEELKEMYPAGKYWNGGNPDTYTSKPCTHHTRGCSYFGGCGCNTFKGKAIQCMGFAYQLAYLIYGGNPYTDWKLNKNSSAIDSLKAGDIVNYLNGGHYIFVTAVDGNTITYADCNNDGQCGIRWDQTISKSTVKKSFVSVDPAPHEWEGSTAKTLSVLYHANGALIPDSEITACKYRVTETVGLNFRTGAGTGYSLIKTLPKNTEFTVNFGDTKEANGYTWGKTTIGSDTGWTVISQFVTKISDLRNQDYFLNESWICKNGENSAFRHQMTYGETYKYGLYDFDSFGLVKEGYRFVGWSRVPEGGGIIDQSSSLRPEEIVPELQEGSRTIHIYAVWEPIAPVLTGISVEKGPDKAVYQMCEALDVSGLKIRLSYDDGSYELIQSGFLVEGVVLDRIGEQRVRVYYGGFECSFNVCVQNILKGDANEDGIISLEDAIHLLFYINFPGRHRVNQDMDLDGNGKEDLNDAVYLLYHVNFPAKYPII